MYASMKDSKLFFTFHMLTISMNNNHSRNITISITMSSSIQKDIHDENESERKLKAYTKDAYTGCYLTKFIVYFS